MISHFTSFSLFLQAFLIVPDFLEHVHAFILPIGIRYSGVWFAGSPIAEDIP